MRFYLKRLFSVRSDELKWIKKQLLNDFTGKDSFRGITLSYAYSANQLGHFTLGFFPVLVIHFFINYFASEGSVVTMYSVLISALTVGLTWSIYEAKMYLDTYREAKSSHFNYIENVIEDTSIDLGFFYLGVYWAIMYLCKIGPDMISFWLGVLMFIVLMGYYFKWYLTKIYQQNADFPFQLRLNQWPYDGIVNPERINQFICSEKNEHLLIYGPRKKGKTSLAVAIGNELSLKHKKCSYISAMKFKGKIIDNPEDDDFFHWNWKEADCLIIDDVDIYDQVVYELNQCNLQAKHLGRKIIWVLNTNDKNHQSMIREDIKTGLTKTFQDQVIKDPIYVNVSELDLNEIEKRKSRR